MSDDDVSWFKDAFTELKDAMHHSFVLLDTMDAKITHLGTRLDGVDTRLDRVENRLDRVENRLDRVEVRLTNLEVEVRDGFTLVDRRLKFRLRRCTNLDTS